MEDVIAAHDDTVKEAWQIYIDRQDRVLDEAVVAVERRSEADKDHEEIARDIARALQARLGIRVQVEVADEGKLPRYEAKAVRVIVRS